MEEPANYLLKLQTFPALFPMIADVNPDVYEIVGESINMPVSSTLFPMITRIIKTGSRAEYLFLTESDVDYIYEIGPVKITSEIDLNTPNAFQFKHIQTENSGFYNVFDQYGGALYSTVLQTKLAPMLSVGIKDIASLTETKASLSVPVEKQKRYVPSYYPTTSAVEMMNRSTSSNIPGNKRKQLTPLKHLSDEDVVIALKLSSWPNDVWKEFTTVHKDAWYQDIIETIKG